MLRVVSGARCRARPCAERRECACVRGNVRAGLDMPGRRRARAGQGHSVAYGGTGWQRPIG
jgi:hypothetical protein